VKHKGQSESHKINLEAIKERLNERRQAIEQTLLSREDLDEPLDDVKDLGDKTLSATMETLKLSLQDNRIDEYRKIEKALSRIEVGGYGLCIDCDEPIANKRLMANPHASRCLACQEDFEGGG
jgi:DnaK suppressor protein